MVVKASSPAKKAAKKSTARPHNRPAAIIPVADDSPFMKILIHGDPGAGKSVLAGTSPDSLLLLNNPSQAVSAAFQGSTADRWHVQDYNDLTEATDFLLYSNDHSYQWVWLDNGTLFQEQGMDQIMLDLVSEAGKGKSHRNQYIPDKAEYLENQSRFGTIVREIIQKGQFNFGIVAHSMEAETPDGDMYYLPAFQGGQGLFSTKLCGYMDVVGYMKVRRLKGGATERSLITDKRTAYYARDNFGGALGGVMKDPTIPKIMEAIAAKRAGRKPATRTVKKSTKTIPKRSAT